MMKKWLLVFAASSVLVACGQEATQDGSAERLSESSSAVASQPAEETVAITIRVSVEGEEVEGGNLSTEVEEGSLLLDVMKENFEIEETDGFITSINGHAQDDEAGKYWLFDVNGEMGMVGANQYEVQEGDLIEWNLAGMEE